MDALHDHRSALEPDAYEEWIEYPDKHVFVPHRDETTYANKVGWFRSGWSGTEEQAARFKAIQWVASSEPA